MEIGEFKKIVAPLLKCTSKKTAWFTLNLLFLIIGGRPAFYDDDDAGGFNALPEKYKKEFIFLCEKFHIILQFEEGRFFAVNPRHRELPASWWSPRSSKDIGQMLGFGCSPRILQASLRKNIMVSIDIETEFGEKTLLSFGCIKDERSRIRPWFEKYKPALEYLRPLFKKYSYKLNITTFNNKDVVPV